jgi:predicted kinase
MNPIFLIVGPPAVGKSTTSRALAAHFPKSLHLPVDDFRDMVVSGIVLPNPVWSDELTQQISLARSSVVHMASTYHEAGFAVVIDDFWDANHDSDYQALISHPHFHRVVLFPDQAVAHQRNLNRSGESPGRDYIDEGIRFVYQQLNPIVQQLVHKGWIMVDTTKMDIQTSVATILTRTKYPE